MNERFIERPDLIKFENDNDLIVVRPSGWELYIKEKDTGEEYSDEFQSRDEAKNVLIKEVEDSRQENEGDDDQNRDDDNGYDQDTYDDEYGDIS